MTQPSKAIDIPFAVPFVHRLRFTRNVLEQDVNVLADVLETSGDAPAKVQFWVDEFVAAAQPDLKHKLRKLVQRFPHLCSTGNVQIVPGGEAIKNDVHVIERMLKTINAADLDRRSYMVVIGGGAVLDAVGFAAAIAHRGIRLVRLPTTTLAQADSGIGVKNSINMFQKKNWVGSFAVPWAVINDESLLETLPTRDFVAGFTEAVKVSLLKDPQLLAEMCEQAKAIAGRDMSIAMPIVQKSAEWHLKHITQGGDPFEALEARPLDYGHWSAHKLEVMTDFELSHGEAVGIGVAIDTLYSSVVHGLPESDAHRVLQCLADLGLPLDHPAVHETDALFNGMEEFRQHLGGRLTLTMLEAVGKPIDVHEVDREKMMEAIEAVAEFARDGVLPQR